MLDLIKWYFKKSLKVLESGVHERVGTLVRPLLLCCNTVLVPSGVEMVYDTFAFCRLILVGYMECLR